MTLTDYPVTRVEIKNHAVQPKELLLFEELRFGKYCDFIELETIVKALEAERIADEKYGRKHRRGMRPFLAKSKAMIQYFEGKKDK